ncbi:protein lzic [Anaeramoeba flamelloides]|uniref:Protein lzic n=1 Tax=Anaeramoeba flamelloides TaxID=1746091 RepID=A0AAV7ZKN5_9EUKA|nr:protein lzic [Anaeramoeba flamelloides]KAJ6232332.1 protein lzic [Anaeramoeba flamelloides]
MSRGTFETEKLKSNVKDQLNRLLGQLEDLEEMRDELEEDEYEETKQDTIEQLKEFQEYLDKLVKGNMTLVDELSGIQLAIRAAVAQAFKTPEVIRLFANKQPTSLRLRLSNIQTQLKLGKMAKETYETQALEILLALKKLGDKLSIQESTFLSNHMNESLKGFVNVDNENISGQTSNKVLKLASKQVSKEKK